MLFDQYDESWGGRDTGIMKRIDTIILAGLRRQTYVADTMV
jgi:hypothetical protein